MGNSAFTKVTNRNARSKSSFPDAAQQYGIAHSLLSYQWGKESHAELSCDAPWPHWSVSPRAGTSLLSWETTSQVTIPQHEEHHPSSTAEPFPSTSPPYQWLLQFSCCRLCIHKSTLWNAPIQEQCNKTHLYYWNINCVCKETSFVFFPHELPSHLPQYLQSWAQNRTEVREKLFTAPWGSALRGANCAQPTVKSWKTEASHIHI